MEKTQSSFWGRLSMDIFHNLLCSEFFIQLELRGLFLGESIEFLAVGSEFRSQPTLAIWVRIFPGPCSSSSAKGTKPRLHHIKVLFFFTLLLFVPWCY